MCYTKKMSKVSFLTGIFSSLLLYFNSNPDIKIVGGFFGFVSLMQLYDWIFWCTTEKNNTNYFVTKLAMVTNHLQPIVLLLLIMFFKNSVTPRSRYLTYVYGICALYYTIKIWNNVDYTLPGSTGLVWKWNSENNATSIYFLFVLVLTALSFDNLTFPLNIEMVFINLFSIGLSLSSFKSEQVGRFWCKIAAWVPLLLLLNN